MHVVGGATYGLLRSLVAPDSPKSKTLEELTALLKDHFEPKPNTIAERFRFHRRSQHQGEYVVELRHLTSRCAFGGYLKEALHDRIVCGLRSVPTQRKLLGEEALTLDRAVEVAVSMESAQKHALALKGSPSLTVGKVDCHERRTDPPANGKPCYRCGKLEHRAAECLFRNASCHKCGKMGHLARVCRSSGRQPVQSGAARGRANVVEGEGTDESGDSDIIGTLHRVGGRATQPYKAVLEVNGRPLEMEIDTGAAVSIISKKTQERLFPSLKVLKPSISLRTYTSELIPRIRPTEGGGKA